MKKFGKKIATIFFTLTLIFLTALTLQPKAAYAQKTIYSAGLSNGPICNCPVLAGDCICAYHK